MPIFSRKKIKDYTYLLTGSRARRATDPLVVTPPTNRRKDRPNRPNGLTKQTYSALVYLPGSSHPRKWHVVAYFTVSLISCRCLVRGTASHLFFLSQGDDYLRLPVIENYDYLRNLRVPEGIFVSSKANGARNDRYSTTSSREDHTLAEFPVQPNLAHHLQHPTSHEVVSRPISSLSPSPSNPLSPTHRHPYSPLAQSTTPRSHPHDISLPGIAAITSPHAHLDPPSASHASYPVCLNQPSPSKYSPLSAEDKRVLSSFRVVL